MKIRRKKKISSLIPIRIESDLLIKIDSYVKEGKTSRQKLIIAILEKAIDDPNFEIDIEFNANK